MIYGFSVKDVKVVCTKIFYAKVETALYSIVELKQRSRWKNHLRQFQDSQIGEVIIFNHQ